MKPDKETIEKNNEDLKELITAHQDYEHRKKVLIDKLEMIRDDTPYDVYKRVLQEVIDFLKEKEV